MQSNVPLLNAPLENENNPEDTHTHRSPNKSRRLPQWLETCACCALFLLAGSTIIVVNKQIFRTFPCPSVISWVGTFSTCMVVCLQRRAGDVFPPLTPEHAWHVVAMAATTAATMYFGNRAYIDLSVSFIQIVKGFNPVQTALVMYCLGISSYSPCEVACLVAVSVGVSVAVFGPIRVRSMDGLACILVASTAESIRVALQHKMIKNMSMHHAELQYYLSPLVCAMLFVSAAVELNSFASFPVPDASCQIYIAASAVLGPAVTLGSSLVIEHTSGVFMKLLTVGRNAALVLFCALTLSEHIKYQELAGYCVSLVGIIAFTWVQRPQ